MDWYERNADFVFTIGQAEQTAYLFAAAVLGFFNETAKNQCRRILDKARMPYQLVAYDVDEHDLSASHMAEQLGQGYKPGI